MTTKRYLVCTALSLFVLLTLLSCAALNRPAGTTTAPDMERLLLEAGFVRNPADTPAKMARIRSEVQRKVIPVIDDGATYYLYADADFCQCLYVGDETAFSRFEDLLRREKLKRNACVDDRLRSAQAEPWREFGSLAELCSDRP